MNSEEFGKLKHSLAGLTPHQRRQIKDQIHATERQQAVHLIVESRVAECPACPHCGQGPVARWGSASGLQRYRCAACKHTLLCADGNSIYVRVVREQEIPLKAVNVKAGIRVVDQIFHIQNVNAYDSRLKGWVRRFHGVATAYLSSYLGWRRLIGSLEGCARTPGISVGCLGDHLGSTGYGNMAL